jgi:23S rRNA (cytosine1962-C5)-methyltransferase
VRLEEHLAPYLKKLSARYGARGAVIKRNLKNPHSRGLVQEQKIIGETPPTHIEVAEHGLKYRVSLTEGQHTGLFLDQRDNRLRVRQLAAGKRVANLFAYTCSFSLAAVSGGAATVVSVDAAAPCLEIGKTALALNGLDKTSATHFIKDDVRLWLKRQSRKSDTDSHEKFGLMICDPPTFSTTKAGGRFSIEPEWESLAKACRKLGSSDADFLFCTNHRAGRKDHYQHILDGIFKHVAVTPAPLDFPVIDENLEHIKMFWCRGNK